MQQFEERSVFRPLVGMLSLKMLLCETHEFSIQYTTVDPKPEVGLSGWNIEPVTLK